MEDRARSPATPRRSSGATRSSSPRRTRTSTQEGREGEGRSEAEQGGTSAACCASRATARCSGRRTSSTTRTRRTGTSISYCNASPVTDGERVVVSFGSAGMYCYDFTGKELWKRTDLGKWEHRSATARRRCCTATSSSSGAGRTRAQGPQLPPRRQQEDRRDRLGARRDVRLLGHAASSPRSTGKDQLILGQSHDVKDAPEPEYGLPQGLRSEDRQGTVDCQGLNSYVYTSPLVADGVAVGMSRLRRLGPRRQARRHRRHHQGPPLAPSQDPRPARRLGLIVGEHVYIVDENGVPHCYELKTGKDLWKDEAGSRD